MVEDKREGIEKEMWCIKGEIKMVSKGHKLIKKSYHSPEKFFNYETLPTLSSDAANYQEMVGVRMDKGRSLEVDSHVSFETILCK